MLYSLNEVNLIKPGKDCFSAIQRRFS